MMSPVIFVLFLLCKPMMVVANVDFPHPDSPTMAKISFFSNVKDTLSTAS